MLTKDRRCQVSGVELTRDSCRCVRRCGALDYVGNKQRPPPPGGHTTKRPSRGGRKPRGAAALGWAWLQRGRVFPFSCPSDEHLKFRWAVWLRLRSAVRERARQAAQSGHGTHGALNDLDAPLTSSTAHTKATDSHTHAKQPGGLIDSDTLTRQQPNVECRAGSAEGSRSRSKNTTKRSASKRHKLQESYRGKDNSLEFA
jgi:hypothetical protein